MTRPVVNLHLHFETMVRWGLTFPCQTRSHQGSARLHRGTTRPQWGTVRPHWGTVRPHWGTARPHWATAVVRLKFKIPGLLRNMMSNYKWHSWDWIMMFCLSGETQLPNMAKRTHWCISVMQHEGCHGSSSIWCLNWRTNKLGSHTGNSVLNALIIKGPNC